MTEIYKANEIKSNEANPVVIRLIKPKIGKRILAVESATKIFKAIDIKSNEPNPVVIGPIETEILL